MNLIKAGRYSATVKEHGITETKAGLPQVAVRFEIPYEDGIRELTWFGSFKEKALPITIKALLACGLKGSNPADDLTIGQEVSLVIDIDTDEETNKERNIIKWVNAPGGLGKVLDAAEARAKLERFSGAVMAAKQSSGGAPKNMAPQKTKKAANDHPFAPGNSDDEKMPWE